MGLVNPARNILRIVQTSPVLAPRPERRTNPPRRKVHLDFHNSEHVARIGSGFDPDEFIATLGHARVDAIVVFAKDMHGYCYYPSATGPVHPGLGFDLLGKQVEACRKGGTEVYAYYCSLWDHFLARHHPEWLSVKRDGSTYMPKEGEPPYWTALCASNEGLVELIRTHEREILTGYEVDGIWFDMPIPRDAECFCANCIAAIKSSGEDPYDLPTQRRYQQELHKKFLARLYDLAQEIKPGCQVDFNNQPCFGLRERISWMDNIDIEALPTSDWGYDFFPVAARYVRTLPRTVYGMTGRFLRGWGDFGGLKTGHQLTAEMLGITALGACCDIGDQAPPSARLDPAVYEAIGQAYSVIERLEPYLQDARTLAEAALIVTGSPLDTVVTPSSSGMTKLLSELSVQLDVVEASAEWERYGLLILEEVTGDESFEERLRAYAESGGKLLLSGAAALAFSGVAGISGCRPCEFVPSYAIMPGEQDKEFEFAVYGESYAWEPTGTCLSKQGVPAFQRGGTHYTSHAQTPFEHATGLVNASANEQIACIGFPIGRLYYETGYWIYRELIARCLNQILPNQMVKPDFPGVLQATVSADPERNRFLIHVFDSTVGRPTPGHPPYYEAGPPFGPVSIRLNSGAEVQSAICAMSGQEASCKVLDNGAVEITVPSLDRYELIVVQSAKH